MKIFDKFLVLNNKNKKMGRKSKKFIEGAILGGITLKKLVRKKGNNLLFLCDLKGIESKIWSSDKIFRNCEIILPQINSNLHNKIDFESTIDYENRLNTSSPPSQKLINIGNITKELARVRFIETAFEIIEEIYIPSQFIDAVENNETLNEFYCLEEPSQVGAQLTAQISHSFYSYLKNRANLNFEKKDSFLRVSTIREVYNEESYDLVLENITSGDKFLIEVKMSQNKNSWQGSTSSTSKVDLFLLINFKINRNLKIGKGKEMSLFSGIFASLVSMGEKKWSGNPKNNNHRTKFEFRVDEWDLDTLKECSIIKGDLLPKQKILHLILN